MNIKQNPFFKLQQAKKEYEQYKLLHTNPVLLALKACSLFFVIGTALILTGLLFTITIIGAVIGIPLLLLGVAAIAFTTAMFPVMAILLFLAQELRKLKAKKSSPDAHLSVSGRDRVQNKILPQKSNRMKNRYKWLIAIAIILVITAVADVYGPEQAKTSPSPTPQIQVQEQVKPIEKQTEKPIQVETVFEEPIDLKSCHPSWRCINETTSAYQNSNCTLNPPKQCVNGCEAGAGANYGQCKPDRVCTPNEKKCDGNTLRQCNSQGTTWKRIKECDSCQNAICTVYGEEPSLTDTLQQVQQQLEDLQKVEQCSIICSEPNTNIPYYKAEWYNVCLKAYTLGGEVVLDDLVKDCKK